MSEIQPSIPVAAAAAADPASSGPARLSPQERLREITAGIEKGIQELFSSERYAQYLRTMSHFHRYSLNNTMLIYMQRPDATLVAGFNKWRDQFGRHVNRGEKSIKIIAPIPVTITQTREKRDPVTHAPLLDDKGQAIMEEVQVKIPRFQAVPVFDVSQTDGKPLPTLVSDLQGKVEHFDAFMEAVLRSSPVPIEIAPIENGADGFFSPAQQKITLREGMSETQTVSAALHEIVHAALHNCKTEQDRAADLANMQPKDRRTEEVEAESVSYAVCQYYGIQTGENSFGYIAEWSRGKDLPELRASLETINRTASELITVIDRNLAEIMHERGLDQVQEQPEAAAGAVPAIETMSVYPAYALVPDPTVKRYYHPEQDGTELPVGPQVAQTLFDQGVPVFSYDKSAGGDRLVRERALLEGTPALYSVTRSDWLDSQHHTDMLTNLLAQQRAIEAAFQGSPANAFMIYQMRDGFDGNGRHQFISLAEMQSRQIDPVSPMYEPLYLAPLPADKAQPVTDILNTLYHQFNAERPADFHGHSLSVSDVVALKTDGQTHYFFVDSFGFQPLDHFIQPESYLRNAEMSMEDDLSMIDGIINNGQNPAMAQQRERLPVKTDLEEKPKAMPSLREQLQQAKQQAQSQPHHSVPKPNRKER